MRVERQSEEKGGFKVEGTFEGPGGLFKTATQSGLGYTRASMLFYTLFALFTRLFNENGFRCLFRIDEEMEDLILLLAF